MGLVNDVGEVSQRRKFRPFVVTWGSGLKKCPACNAENLDERASCGVCGASLDRVGAASVSPNVLGRSSRPARGFVLALAGGTVSMIPYAFPLFSVVRVGAFDNSSIGLVIMVASVLLYEMPERHTSLGALVSALSMAELASTIVVVQVWQPSFTGSPYLIWTPIVGSLLSLLGGLIGVRWKPSR